MSPRSTTDWAGLISSLEKSTLPEYLPKQRWFGGKSRQIQRVRVVDWAEFANAAMMFLEVTYASDASDEYFAAFMMKNGALQDALRDDAFCQALLNLRELRTHAGRIVGQVSEPPALPIRRGSAEQSNSSIIYGDKLILKLFRRQQPGPNPDIEIGRFLTEKAGFDRVPPFAGSLEYRREGRDGAAIAIVQKLVANEGDGWIWATEQLDCYYETCARTANPVTLESARDIAGEFLGAIRLLGRRTGELHVALASCVDNPAFAPEKFTGRDTEEVTERVRQEAGRAFNLLKDNLSRVPQNALEMARLALANRTQIIDRLLRPSQDRDYGKRIRTHGDYHLGQVLRAKNDFVILDFEGEPARPLAQRRAKYSPLKDVAGMLRSFSYAANAALMTYAARYPDDLVRLEPWGRFWEQAAGAEFLSAFRDAAGRSNTLPAGVEDFRKLLDTFLFEKAMYELTYELNNRPTWVRIPLAGILALDA